MSSERSAPSESHIKDATEAISNAMVSGNWEHADQVYAVISFTHAMLAVAAELSAIRTHLEKSREYHS